MRKINYIGSKYINKVENESPSIQSSHAILLLFDKYVLQLRDDKPGIIAAPGIWSLFGGKIQSGEGPLQAIQREIVEELSINPLEFKFLWFTDYYSNFEQTTIRTWFFVSDVSEVWSTHRLTEGQDVSVFTFEQVKHLEMPGVMRDTIERFHKGCKFKSNGQDRYEGRGTI